ncbi:MAG: ATP-dependent helicase C-terminal domain-containing protein, partial [Alphaproteobacteria bacterium]
RAGAGRADADLRTRLAALAGARTDADRGALARIDAVARDLARAAGIRPQRAGDGTAAAGALLATAYPDRVARRSDPRGIYRLSGGGQAVLAEGDALVVEEWLAIADLDGDRQRARIFLAAPLSRPEIDAIFAAHVVRADRVEWDARAGAVAARRERRLDRLVLDDGPLPDPDPAAVLTALLQGIAGLGPAALPWTPAARQLRARVMLMRRVEDEAWPDWSDAALTATLPDWLGPHLGGMTQAAHLARLDLACILSDGLGWELRRRLDADAPTHLTVPSGSRIALDYETGETPVLAVRLQEMFGARETPMVAGGRVPVVVHLLSPAGRPVQVTRDLAGFWRGSYTAVRSDLRGRYPKHFWPEDPTDAPATRRVRPREGDRG